MDNFKINFVVCGFQKCGTSSLANYLDRHEEINFSDTKEPMHFLEVNHSSANLKLFKSLFKSKHGLRGEASTAYGFPHNSEYTAKALFDHNPEMKLIFLVRNPSNRVLSSLRHGQLRSSGKKTTFGQKLERAIANTQYGKVLKDYLNHFPSRNILVIKFEDLINQKALPEISDFLNIQYDENLTLDKVNITAQKVTKAGWYRYYEKYHNLILQIPLSKLIRQTFKSILLKTPDSNQDKKPNLVELTEKDKLKIEQSLIQDSVLFKDLIGFNYFDLTK